jgi:hypothetical protein
LGLLPAYLGLIEGGLSFEAWSSTTLLDTEANHLFAVLEHRKAGNSAHHYLRRLHNYALHLGWLLAPVMADAAWPPILDIINWQGPSAYTGDSTHQIDLGSGALAFFAANPGDLADDMHPIRQGINFCLVFYS